MSTDKQFDRETLQKQLREVESQLEHWKAQAENIGADAKVEYQRRLDDLEKRRVDITKKLNELEDSGSGAWQNVKETIDGAWEDIKGSFDNATERFREN